MEIASRLNGRRAVLQRRSSLSNAFQSGLDGLAVIGITAGLVHYHIGIFASQYVIMLLLLMGIVAVVYDHVGLYRSNANFTQKAITLLKAWTFSFAALLLIAFLTKQSDAFSRQLVAELYGLGFVTQLALHLVVRMSRQKLWARAHQVENAVIVGEGRLAKYLSQKISTNPWLGQKVVGSILLQDAATGDRSTDAPRDMPAVLGHVRNLPDLIDSHQIRVVYIVTPMDASRALKDIYFTLLDKHVAVHWIPDIFSLRLVNHSVREIAGIPVLTLSETPLTGTRMLLKALEDRVLAALIVLLISPLLLVVAVAVRLDSPGPIFFRQNRTGFNGRAFRIWKFRSMYVHQPENGVIKQAQRNDPRITRVGGFLRRTSLDELPQLFNVLAGDMSLVGPRPHAIQHDEEYSRRIDDYFARHKIKPGMTGLAQVRGLRGETRDIDQMIQRVESDIEYINNWSIWFDLSILVRTVSVVAGRNVY